MEAQDTFFPSLVKTDAVYTWSQNVHTAMYAFLVYTTRNIIVISTYKSSDKNGVAWKSKVETTPKVSQHILEEWQ